MYEARWGCVSVLVAVSDAEPVLLVLFLAAWEFLRWVCRVLVPVCLFSRLFMFAGLIFHAGVRFPAISFWFVCFGIFVFPRRFALLVRGY